MKPEKIKAIKDDVEWLLTEVYKDEKKHHDLISQVDESYRKSAINLINYLSIRSFDIRKLQRKLGYLGMSRLARAEAHVEASLNTTLFFLRNILGEKSEFPSKSNMSIKQSQKKLKNNTKLLLGKAPKNRRLRIMVTIPLEAVDDPDLVEQMVASGMDCARINCAHDGPEQWRPMITNIKKASKKLQKEVTITMDIGGPKIRTGEIKRGPKVKHIQPTQDKFGEMIQPAVLSLVSQEIYDFNSDDLPVDAEWLEKILPGDIIFTTGKDEKQTDLQVVEKHEGALIVHCFNSIYISTGTILKSKYGNTSIGEIPALEQTIYLKNGDILELYKERVEGCPATFDSGGKIKARAKISCTLPETLDNVEVGDRIYFDDGKFKGVVDEKHPDKLLIKIIQAKSNGAKLKADKGINFPDSNLKISGLTSKDKEDLKFIAQHADVVNFSFVNHQQDVKDILNELEMLGVKDKLGIILKIETQKGYDNLTKILLEAMKSNKIGVMIARGDLAIEAGWNRIGSIQKEMLAICNASHIPIVWATQVLENLAKKGLPSRSEITDAVSAAKADCVMLNKGPHIVEAINLLNQLIESSEIYQDKNAPMLPKLKKILK